MPTTFCPGERGMGGLCGSRRAAPALPPPACPCRAGMVEACCNGMLLRVPHTACSQGGRAGGRRLLSRPDALALWQVGRPRRGAGAGKRGGRAGRATPALGGMGWDGFTSEQHVEGTQLLSRPCRRGAQPAHPRAAAPAFPSCSQMLNSLGKCVVWLIILADLIIGRQGGGREGQGREGEGRGRGGGRAWVRARPSSPTQRGPGSQPASRCGPPAR